MNLDKWKEAQLKEILQWANTIDKILLPQDLQPTHLHDYPRCRELSDKLKRVCQFQVEDLSKQVQAIEDDYMNSIEEEVFTFAIKNGIPEFRKKFASTEKRERELRGRLAADEVYQRLAGEKRDWQLMVKDWAAHANKLRQEERILETEHSQTGATTLTVSKHYVTGKK